MENLARKLLTADEYFTLEESSDVRHEFYRGELFAMAGATRKHNLITNNLMVILRGKFKGKPCEVYTLDMRVEVDEYNHYTYPDLSIVCDKRVFRDKKETTLVNSTVIVEVLSDSTESYDRGKKFQAYRTISSLQTYVLVSTNYKNIEIFQKGQDGHWTLFEPNGEGMLAIPSLDVSLAVDEVYEGVEWEEGEGDSKVL
jgi:Uma2 family endonuclease